MMPTREEIYGVRIMTRIPRMGLNRKELISRKSTENRPSKHSIIASTVIFLLSLCGVVYQIYYEMEEYLKYDILSSIHIVVDENLEAPELSLCFGFKSIINQTLAKRKYPHQDFDPTNTSDIQISVGDMFAFSPQGHDLIDGCRMRLRDNFLTQSFKTADCINGFEIKKFLRQGHICYKIGLRNLENNASFSGNFSHFHVKHSFVSPGMLFQLTLNSDVLKEVEYFTAAVFDAGWYPEVTQTFMVHASRSGGTFNIFYLSYDVKLSYLLEPPYRDGCINYHYYDKIIISQDVCKFICHANLAKEYVGRIPLEATITEERLIQDPSISEYLFIPSSFYYSNDTFIGIFNDIEAKCDKICKRPDCQTEYFATKLLTRERGDSFLIRLFTPIEFNLVTAQTPDFSLAQFLNSALSLLAVWFGISCLGTGFSVVNFLYRRLSGSRKVANPRRPVRQRKSRNK